MRHLTHLFVCIACCGLTGPVVAQNTGEILRGEVIAATCFTCHGTDGKSPGMIPALNGIPAESLRRSMQEFRDGRRPSTVMGRHAAGYSDEEVASIADYFSRVK